MAKSTVRQPIMPATESGRRYRRLRRSLLFIRLQQAVRRACDVTGVGPSAGGRLACVVITAAVGLGGCLGLAVALGAGGVAGVALAVAAFFLTLATGAALVLIRSDDSLAERKEAALRDLPRAKADWLLYRKQVQVERERRRAEQQAEREREAERAERRREREAARVIEEWVDRRPATAGWLDGNGSFALEVVGEANYQRNLERVCGGRTRECQDRIMTAVLVLEDDNPYDFKAVCVTIDGWTVGYLSRDKARVFRARVRREGIRGYEFPCKANVRGGWDRGDGDRGYFGVWLDVVLYGRGRGRR
jgi:hypothetical protein